MGYLNIQIQAVRDLLAEGRTTEADAGLTHLSQIVEEANTEIREFIYEIKTPLLFKEGFLHALEHHADRFKTDFQIDVAIRNPNHLSDADLSLLAQAQLFRIIQETLANVRKHSRGDRVEIIFDKTDQQLQVTVSDNGIGFEPVRAAQRKHFGLEIMRERAVHAGGKIQIQSAAQKGTQVIITLPLSKDDRRQSPETIHPKRLKLLLEYQVPGVGCFTLTYDLDKPEIMLVYTWE